MKRKNSFLWLAITAAGLMGFSFAAGYGLRALMWTVRQGGIPALVGSLADGSERAFSGYPRIASRGGGGASMIGHGQVMSEVISRLKELYVEPLPPSETLSTGAVEGMLTSLSDTNTRLLGPKEWSAVSDEQSGAFRGLGAVLTIRRHVQEDDEGRPAPAIQITVVTPMPGSPAEKAGLQPGDRITSIDDHWIAPTHLLKKTLNMYTEETDYSLDPRLKKFRTSSPDEEQAKPPSAEELKKNREANDHLRDRWRNSLDIESAMEVLAGEADGEHTLTVARAGASKPITVKVQFARTRIQPVAKRRLAPTVGYLQVRQINADTVRALDQALAEFRASGYKSLVLDLRHSPGGSLAQTQEIAGRFLSGGALAVLEQRDSSRNKVKKPLPVKPVEQRARFSSVVVLVDGGTAGASEVLAAALRDAGLAKLVGSTTFGDGTEQKIFPLDNGAAVSITTAHMFSRKGTDFDGKGLKPDVPVAAAAGADPALEQALRLVRPS